MRVESNFQPNPLRKTEVIYFSINWIHVWDNNYRYLSLRIMRLKTLGYLYQERLRSFMNIISLKTFLLVVNVTIRVFSQFSDLSQDGRF